MVAPYAGAWIETGKIQSNIDSGSMSLPTRERGLKPCARKGTAILPNVAPYAGAWIETFIPQT